VLTSRLAALLFGLRQVLTLQVEETALGLHQLDLEDAAVADAGHLPDARGVRYAHDAHEKLLLYGVQHLLVPVVAVKASHKEPKTCSAESVR
jgi:hypothetical protein